ncbi:sensor domain-containing diguanylate cyclase [Marinobacter sp. CHS3-4]|uniref:GGDEF domain-containing protein n=1 Tax=Marinobacter sp. CHS3-4 TaxID=3045174 RepID=UPI0024B56282|nr:sensor domain-containing diguanylate cyclase [Marinobacter sp. CHS3-4]MDI9243656.1 diguanylate cyclase [Marinobacter sp. CHS3-4]
MDIPQETDLDVSIEQSRSGLREGHRRSLMRTLFLVTACALVVFGTLQVLNNNGWFALFEFLAAGLLFWGRGRIQSTPNLHRWIYSYLVSGFFFALVILVLPDVSITAFVWILMIPVLAYLLLGRAEGLRLSLPFLIGGCVIYALSLGSFDSAMALIDLLNLVLCAVLMLCFVHIYETRREEAERKLFSVAQTDYLTGLANRASFQSVLTRNVAECHRSGGGFALVIMDVDHFKLVNDTMGHDAGDRALVQIGQLLTERLRNTDFVGRLGGEEFGIILRDVKPDHSYELMEELRQRIADTPVAYGEATIRLTASFGIAHFPDHAQSADTLYRVADRCLYAGKRAGRNTVARAGVSVVGL